MGLRAVRALKWLYERLEAIQVTSARAGCCASLSMPMMALLGLTTIDEEEAPLTDDDAAALRSIGIDLEQVLDRITRTFGGRRIHALRPRPFAGQSVPAPGSPGGAKRRSSLHYENHSRTRTIGSGVNTSCSASCVATTMSLRAC